jgi:DNA-binding NarL/FixJ family response regulator
VIRVGIVAAARAMRLGLRGVLENLPGLSVVMEASDASKIPAGQTDVLVVAWPAGIDGYANPSALLVLTDNADDIQDLMNLHLPAWGVLSMDASEDELGAAIHALAEGLWVGAPALLGSLMDRISMPGINETDPTAQALTARENQVLQLTAQGLANKQIASQLEISEHTVKFHLSSIYAKLGSTSRTEAVRAGARRGLVIF